MNIASYGLERFTAIDDDWNPRYGLALLLVAATFVCLSALPSTAWAIVATLLLQAATLIVILRTSRARPAVLRVAYAGVLLAIASGIALLLIADVGSAPSATGTPVGGTFLITALLVLLSPPVIMVGMWRDLRVRQAVTVQALYGALCIYLLIGIFFALLYGAVAVVDGAAFFTDGTDGDGRIRTYFSFVTLTTLGYGDFAPAGALGRTAATVEALIGQIYLVTIIGVLVGRLGQGLRRKEG